MKTIKDAVIETGGKWPSSVGSFLKVRGPSNIYKGEGSDFDFGCNSDNTNDYWIYLCTREEFKAEAKRMGYINGYRFGVEYPTNGKRPDFMDAVKSVLNYCHETGVFTWKNDGNNQVKSGSNAGTPDRKGYIQITLNGKRLKAHRLAYAIIHNLKFNEIPQQIDHVDGIKYNNIPSNLRAATGSQNQHNRPAYANNTSGFKGVTWNRRRGKWQSQIQISGVRVQLGCFDCIFDAAKAYDAKAVELHKEFALTNKSMGLINE